MDGRVLLEEVCNAQAVVALRVAEEDDRRRDATVGSHQPQDLGVSEEAAAPQHLDAAQDVKRLDAELRAALGEVDLSNAYAGTDALPKPNGSAASNADIDVPMYDVDALVRRASALQLTPEAKRARGETE